MFPLIIFIAAFLTILLTTGDGVDALLGGLLIAGVLAVLV